MENNNKSQAEIYREERKERLAKAASKNAKKSPAFTKAKKIIGKVIAIVLAIVIAVGAVGGVLNFFGVPQRTIKISAGEKDYAFTLAEFNFFYYSVWNQIENTAYQYETQYSQYYGAGAGVSLTGYDYTKSPASQDYKDDYSNFTGIKLADLKAEKATWADVMKFAAISQLLQTKYGAEKAKEAGLSVTPEQQSEIDEQLKTYADNARKEDYSTNRYLRQIFGNGITEKLVREIMTNQTLASAYFEKYSDDTKNAITKEQVEEKYNADRSSYDVVTLRAYPFAAEYDAEKADDAAKAEARKKAKAAADEFLAKATDEKTFIELAKNELKKDKDNKDKDADTTTAMKNAYKTNVTSNICEEAANWAFSSDTKVGDSKVFAATEDDFFVVMLTVTAHKDTTSSGNDVRHILFKFPDKQKDADGNEIALTDAQKKKTREEAEKVFELYKKNPTEENFINLTKEYTQDVDSDGNPNSNGLYEGITASSSYVEGFLDWAIDDARKTGDAEIVETEFGYHIMYYVKSQGETWEQNIKNEILSKASDDLISNIDSTYVTKVNMNNAILNWAFKQQTKHINQTVINITSNSNG